MAGYQAPQGSDGLYQNQAADYADDGRETIYNAQAAGGVSEAAEAAQYTDGGSIGTKMHAAGDGGWRDKGFLFGFLAHIIGLIAVAGYFGPKMVADLSKSSQQQDQPGETTSENSNSQVREVIGLLVVAAIVGSVWAAVWLRIMQHFQGRVVHVSIVANVCIVVLALIISFAFGAFATGIIYLVYVIILLLWYYWVRDRVPMAEATLAASTQAVLDNPGPIYVAYLMALVQVAWAAFWAFTFVSVYWATTTFTLQQDPVNPGNQIKVSQGSTAGQQVALTFCVFSLYWTSQVLKNIGHVTTAGMVASWWLVTDIDRPTLGAFKRACTTSFGSICFGSLLVALVQTIVYLLRQTRGVAAAFAACILSIFERIIRWFNKFAFVEVAMYGYPFLDAARATQTLMQAKFWELLINDNLVTAVFLMGNMLAGVMAGLICGVWAVAAGIVGAVGIAVLAFLIGFLLSSLFMIVLDSAVATTYVVWAEDPAAMLRNRPDAYNRIALAAQGRYPTEYQQAVGHRLLQA